eukprot:scaffold20916_cov97-Isochrysis_galbana.AAC.2
MGVPGGGEERKLARPHCAFVRRQLAPSHLDDKLPSPLPPVERRVVRVQLLQLLARLGRWRPALDRRPLQSSKLNLVNRRLRGSDGATRLRLWTGNGKGEYARLRGRLSLGAPPYTSGVVEGESSRRVTSEHNSPFGGLGAYATAAKR